MTARLFFTTIASVLVMLSAAASTASAQDDILPARFGEVGRYADRYEARFGVMAYDRGAFTTDEYSGTVINGEFLGPRRADLGQEIGRFEQMSASMPPLPTTPSISPMRASTGISA